MSLRLNGSASGYSEIAAPAAAGDQTFTLPTTGGTVLTNVSDIEAQVKTATNATGSAPVYSCRAWVNFNGTGTVAIRASGNVSSITDDGAGIYKINFATDLEDANYAVCGTCSRGGNATNYITESNRDGQNSTSLVAIGARDGNGVLQDKDYVYVAVFR